MWNRACPLCFAKMPRTLVLARSEELTCPACRTVLEISRPSKLLSAGVGLLAAYVIVRVMGRAETTTAFFWTLPLVGAVFAYALGSALTLFFVADLVVQPPSSSAGFPHSHS